MEAMELNDIAEMLCRNLISEGFIIQRYDAYSSKLMRQKDTHIHMIIRMIMEHILSGYRWMKLMYGIAKKNKEQIIKIILKGKMFLLRCRI